MNLSPFLSNAFLMCFDRRAAIWPDTEADLAKLGIHPRRYVMGTGDCPFFVYDHVDRHKGPLPARQRLNYAEAVINLVRKELEKGSDHLLLVEDDCQFHPESLAIWGAVQEQLSPLSFEFDAFYLHAVRVHARSREVAPNVLQLDSSHGLRCVILRRRLMERIARLEPQADKGIDGLIKDYCHPGLEIYSVWPCILRADRDQWSHQDEMSLEKIWLDWCVMERGQPWE